MKFSFLIIVFFLYLNTLLSQDLSYARILIDKLTSPELHGRGYTNQGNMLAAEYISSEFKNMGLLPFTKNYFQKFQVSINTFPGKLIVKFNGKQLKPGIDYLVESSSPAIKGLFSVILTNCKEIDTEEKLIKLIEKAGDRFILIDKTDEYQMDTERKKRIGEYINFLKYSPQIQCKGIIIPTKEKLNWEASSFVNVRPVILTNTDIGPDAIQSLDLIIENKYIPKYETQNIIGFLKGSVSPDSFLVISAHYDHLGEMGDSTYFPGANDNASGVAMLLNLAKYYAQNQPKYSILFIALAAEEIGLLGAKEFAEHPLIDLKKIKFLINFDLAGTGEEGIRVVNGSIFKDKFDLLTIINKENNLLPKVDIRGAACISDHCMFYQKGVPCFYIYTQGGIKAYHDIYDKSETLPLTEFTDFYTLIIQFFNTF